MGDVDEHSIIALKILPQNDDNEIETKHGTAPGRACPNVSIILKLYGKTNTKIVRRFNWLLLHGMTVSA
jgi:hypothetical protein